MSNNSKIDYGKATEKSSFPVYQEGSYRCIIHDVVDRPDNTYNGELKPTVEFHILPIEDLENLDGNMFDSEGKELKNKFTKDDGTTVHRFIYFSTATPPHLNELSDQKLTNFTKIVSGVFGREAYAENFRKAKAGQPHDFFDHFEAYKGNRIICTFGVKEKENGGLKNTIESIRQDKTWTPKPYGDNGSVQQPQPGFTQEPPKGDLPF